MVEEAQQAFIMTVVLVIIFSAMVWTILFFTLLRFIFPKYVAVKGPNTYTLGRAYWYSEGRVGAWGKQKRLWCGAHVELQPYALVAQRVWLNVLEPWSSMYRFWLPVDHKRVRGPTTLKIWHSPHIYRRISVDGSTEYVVAEDANVFSASIENREAEELEELRMRQMVVSTQKAAQASIPHIQEALRHGSFEFSHDAKADIEDMLLEKERELGGVG